MDRYFVDLMIELGNYAFILSIIINIVISLLGVVPSVFITAANIKFFGFENGLILSIIGEALGAIISFYLYRKGVKKILNAKKIKNKYMTELSKSNGKKAFFMIIALRIFPLMPSGIVTLAAAISKVGIVKYSLASIIGKVPSLLIEAYSIQQILIWDWKGKIILSLFLIITIWLMLKKRRGE